ncbi:hypothetical protein PsorP6_001358 [Peronosclerospora sorghi]|uniref:Uncharacterized protein n=1 Tax=Peronosclerospora sorghi TaxID=230839 RepID=A0ACC0WW90_9STRA|nr:hypothetical protein PsorP6_001358 [Peronosclerospora sorghi]
MPLVIFVGVNQHGQSIPFGCALLRNEKRVSLMWLLETWKKAMGCGPDTTFTDRDEWICQFTNDTSSLLRVESFTQIFVMVCIDSWTQVPSVHAGLFGILRLPSSTAFEAAWAQITFSHNLSGNDRVRHLYSIREKWEAPYFRDVFTARLSTTQRAESINAYWSVKNIFTVGEYYISQRWRHRSASVLDAAVFASSSEPSSNSEPSSSSEPFSSSGASSITSNLSGLPDLNPPASQPKGRPVGSKRIRSGMEKSKRRCGKCRAVGHTIRKCPEREYWASHTVRQHPAAKG